MISSNFKDKKQNRSKRFFANKDVKKDNRVLVKSKKNFYNKKQVRVKNNKTERAAKIERNKGIHKKERKIKKKIINKR